MRYPVFLSKDAHKDLEEIYDYIYTHDSSAKAEYLLGEIEKTLEKLSMFPERGAYPEELSSIGILEYREVYFKPYRIIYRVKNRKVYVMLIADGRRSLQTLLLRRLLS